MQTLCRPRSRALTSAENVATSTQERKCLHGSPRTFGVSSPSWAATRYRREIPTMMTTRTTTTKRTRTGTKNRRSSESPTNSCRARRDAAALLERTTRIGECPMIRSAFAVAAASIAASFSFSQPILGQEETDQRLGTVHFETSCNEVAQRRFDRAMRYQHSFWYRESKELFEEVLKVDPDCGIAYWGIALSLLNNPHAPPPVGNLPLGLAAIEKAKATGAKTQRERDLINALAAFYTGYDEIDHRTRVLAYLKAMEGVAQAYPNDDEAQILYAIELNVAAPPSDKTYAMQLKGAAILEPIFLRQPRHPGVAHYLIHLYDTPALAERGLDAAKRYSQIAPAAPHAQHMPSHIFTRVGYWKESIGSNTEAARAAKASNEGHDQLHAMDYLVYAYLQMGQDAKAQAVIEEMR